MAFADTIKQLPFQARTPTGSGFFPPMFRASQHILYLVGCIADDDVTVTEKDALGELEEARKHWDARLKTPALSTDIITKSDLIGTAIAEAIAEYPKWKAETATTNLRDLAHRIAQHAADLDRELVGNRDADPGTSL